MRMVLLLLPLLTGLGAAQDGQRQLVENRDMWVELSFDDDGNPLLSIQARDVSAEALTRLIAQKIMVDADQVFGFEEIGGDPKVSVHLHRRSPVQVLRWALGSVGIAATLGANSITVASDVGPNPDGKAMLRKAGARYFGALKRYDDYPLADRAVMARAQIHERLGKDDRAAAALTYDNLIQEYPRSELVPEAMLRAARLRGLLGQWQESALRYEELAGRIDAHPYHSVARLELADALCRAGEEGEDLAIATAQGEKASYVLDALDTNYPTQEPRERFARLLVRSRSLSLAGRPVRALQALDAAMRYSSAGAREPRILALRALALARAGEHGASSTGWLAWADAVGSELAPEGYLRAAREALLAGEEVAVLMIESRAVKDGFGDRLAAPAAEARARLGLPVAAVSGLDATANLTQGEIHVADRRWKAAVSILRPAFQQRETLTPDQHVRLALAYARALDRDGHQEAAIDAVRAIAGDLTKRQHLNQLYLLAADLYEGHDQLDLAVEALKGRL